MKDLLHFLSRETTPGDWLMVVFIVGLFASFVSLGPWL